ncbi:MAG: hypothetical protein QXZ68_06575 [Candidatus Bathyarchaeia archaeon]
MGGQSITEPASLLNLFINVPVVVDTPVGPVTGVLLRADRSEHGGVGCLLLETRNGRNSWTLIKEWICVKRRM